MTCRLDGSPENAHVHGRCDWQAEWHGFGIDNSDLQDVFTQPYTARKADKSDTVSRRCRTIVNSGAYHASFFVISANPRRMNGCGAQSGERG